MPEAALLHRRRRNAQREAKGKAIVTTTINGAQLDLSGGPESAG